MHLAVVDATGQFRWDDGNIPGSREATAKDIVLNYGQNYNIKAGRSGPPVTARRERLLVLIACAESHAHEAKV